MKALGPIGYFVTFTAGVCVTHPDTWLVGLGLSIIGGMMLVAAVGDAA